MRAVSLGKPLNELGFDVTLLASRAKIGLHPVHTDWHGVRVLQMPDILPLRLRNGGLSPVDLAGRLWHVAREHYDLIHAFDHRPCAAGPALLRPDRRVPFVSDWADWWGKGGVTDRGNGPAGFLLSRFDRVTEIYVRRHCDAVTAISSTLEAQALALGLPPGRVIRVGVGTNADLIRPMDKDAMRLKYGLAAEAVVLVHSGFASHDLGMLAETFIRLASRQRDFVLLMTGPRLADFDRRILAAGLSRKVIPFGVVPYEILGEILACGDLLVLPYGQSIVNVARFPNRFGDYLAAGRAIATNDVGDVGRAVRDEGVGIATAPQAAAFAEGILELLRDPERRREMGERARALAETRYSWRNQAEKLAALYRRLLAGDD